VAEFLLDTEVASRLMRAERRAVTSLRRSGAKSVSISSITMAELLYGARQPRTAEFRFEASHELEDSARENLVLSSHKCVMG
jgi:predicted nucleic acid-binding protein